MALAASSGRDSIVSRVSLMWGSQKVELQEVQRHAESDAYRSNRTACRFGAGILRMSLAFLRLCFAGKTLQSFWVWIAAYPAIRISPDSCSNRSRGA